MTNDENSSAFSIADTKTSSERIFFVLCIREVDSERARRSQHEFRANEQRTRVAVEASVDADLVLRTAIGVRRRLLHRLGSKLLPLFLHFRIPHSAFRICLKTVVVSGLGGVAGVRNFSGGYGLLC